MQVNINMNLHSKTYHKVGVGSNEKCARREGMKSNKYPCVKVTHCTRQIEEKGESVGGLVGVPGEEGKETWRPKSSDGSQRLPGAPYLFLVLVLHAEPLLDAVASLQEGLPLGSLCQDAHKQPWQVDTGEEHCVGKQLRAERTETHMKRQGVCVCVCTFASLDVEDPKYTEDKIGIYFKFT